MPVSAQEGKQFIKEWFSKQDDIKTIVDIGCGAGTYRDLLGGQYTWIGVEAFHPYIERYNLKEKYNKVIYGDIREISMPKGDCVIFGDVLEHMTKHEAEIIKEIAENLFKHIVVSLPLGLWEQGAVNGNEYERHLAEWSKREAEAFFNDFSIKHSEGHIGIYIK